MGLFDDKKKSKMTEEEANETIKEWADIMEIRLKGDDYESLQNEIWMAVKNERLIFNRDKMFFEYVLLTPIALSDGTTISKIKISEADMTKKKGLGKFKDDIETQAAFTKAYISDSEGEEIPIGYIMRIMDRDQIIINAVILGFFVQVVPGKK